MCYHRPLWNLICRFRQAVYNDERWERPNLISIAYLTDSHHFTAPVTCSVSKHKRKTHTAAQLNCHFTVQYKHFDLNNNTGLSSRNANRGSRIDLISSPTASTRRRAVCPANCSTCTPCPALQVTARAKEWFDHLVLYTYNATKDTVLRIHIVQTTLPKFRNLP